MGIEGKEKKDKVVKWARNPSLQDFHWWNAGAEPSKNQSDIISRDKWSLTGMISFSLFFSFLFFSFFVVDALVALVLLPPSSSQCAFLFGFYMHRFNTFDGTG